MLGGILVALPRAAVAVLKTVGRVGPKLRSAGRFLAFTLAVGLLGQSALAATYTWNGGASGVWARLHELEPGGRDMDRNLDRNGQYGTVQYGRRVGHG